MSGSRGLTEDEAREAGEIARKLLAMRNRVPPRIERRQRTGKFDSRSAMRAEHDPDGGDRIFRRRNPEPPSATTDVPGVVLEALRSFSRKTCAVVVPRIEVPVAEVRVREYLWALHRRARLRARLRGGFVYAVVNEEVRNVMALETRSTEWVRFLDRFSEFIDARPLSEEEITELNDLVRREAEESARVSRAPIPDPEERRPAPPPWDESVPELVQ